VRIPHEWRTLPKGYAVHRRCEVGTVGVIAAGCRVLVVEDEYLIAHEIAYALALLGVIPVGPVATLQQAIELLKRFDHFDGAVLDINLQGQMVFPLADALEARGVPFIFITGYDDQVIPARYADVERCEKPVNPHEVLQKLFSVIAAKEDA
jgi:CheY-like chemotaxis protein